MVAALVPLQPQRTRTGKINEPTWLECDSNDRQSTLIHAGIACRTTVSLIVESLSPPTSPWRRLRNSRIWRTLETHKILHGNEQGFMSLGCEPRHPVTHKGDRPAKTIASRKLVLTELPNHRVDSSGCSQTNVNTQRRVRPFSELKAPNRLGEVVSRWSQLAVSDSRKRED